MAIQTAPSPRQGTMFFSDARSCKDWLRAIHLTNIPQAQQNVIDGLRILNRGSEFAALDRLTCMELMRDKVSFLLSEQRARYSGKTIPLQHGDSAAWQVSQTLLNEMEAGYRRCWSDASTEDAPLAAHAALIIQRIMRYIGLQMLMAGFIYRRFDPALWMRLHLQWLEAETRGLVEKKVKDSIGSIDGYSSIRQAYTAVLLGQAANTYELMPRQIDFVDAVLKRFGHKVMVGHAGMPTGLGPQCAVDLLSNEGGGFHASIPAAEHIRVLQLDELAKSLRRRIRKLGEGENPATLDLPPEWSAHEAGEQLLRLYKLWCEGTLSRPPATVPEEAEANLCFGISATHFFMSGNIFEQPDVKRELTRQETNDITMFGKVSEATIRARYAEFNYGTEKWSINDESRGFLRMMRPPNSSFGLAIGKLVGIKIGSQDSFYLGVVHHLAEELSGSIYATFAMLPGKPEAISVRSADNRSRAGTYVQGFRLAPMPALKVPETLVVPSALAHRGRGIDIFHPGHGSPKEVKVLDFVERGVDFDRVTIS